MDIQLISTDDLIAELKKRFDEWVFIGRQKTNRTSDTYRDHYQGGMTNCIGLCELEKEIIIRDFFKDERKEEV